MNHGVGNLLFDLKDLIWSYEVNNDSIAKLAKRLDHYTTEFSKNNKFKIYHKNYIHNENTLLPHLWNRQILLTLKEAINNAYKHSKANTIRTYLFLDESNTLKLQIVENGTGFNKNIVKRSGIANMKKRAESMGYKLQIISSPEKGTELIIAGKIIHH